MKHLFSFFAIASILTCSVAARAQSLAQFRSPANKAIGVPIADSIVITTHYKIDTSSLISQLGDTVTLDNVKPLYNVLVISQFVHDSLSDSSWGPLSAGLQCTILNDTTLSVSLATLSPGTPYIAQINSLRVIDSFGDTLTVPDTIQIKFKTAYGTQQILGSTVLDSAGILRCSDTIRVHFDQALDSANTPSGPLFQIYALTPTTDFPSGPTDTTPHYRYSDSLISSSSWLDPSDSSTVCIASASLSPGQKYIFQEIPSRLTGDSSANRNYMLNVKSSEQVRLSTSGITADSTFINHKLFSPGRYNLSYGDTGYWIAPPLADSFQFAHWSCPGVPGIDGIVNDTLRLTPDCSNLRDLNISANFVLLPIDTLKLDTIPSCDSIEVRSLQGSVLATYGGSPTGGSSNSFPIRGGTKVMLYARQGTCGSPFDHWNSNDGKLNGSTSPIIEVSPINGNIWATPVYGGPWPLGVEYNIGGQVVSADPTLNLVSCGCLVTITTPPAGVNQVEWSLPLDATPVLKPVVLSIPQYYYAGSPYLPSGNYQDIGLWQTNVFDPTNISSIPLKPSTVQNVGTSLGGPVMEDVEYQKYIRYDVSRFNVFLDVQIAMTDSATEAPPTDLGLVLGSPTNQTGNIVVFVEGKDIYNSNAPATPLETDHSWNGSTYLHDDHFLTYKAGDNVNVQARAGGDYSFVGWIVYTSTDNGSTWNTATPPDPTWNSDIHGADGSGDGTIIIAKAIFKKEFVLRTIAVDQDPGYVGSPTNYVYAADGFQANLINGTQWSSNEREMWLSGTPVVNGTASNPTLQLKFHFSDAIDPATLWRNIMCIEQNSSPVENANGIGVYNLWPFTFFLDQTSPNPACYSLSNGDSDLTWNISSLGGYEFTLYPNLGINPWGRSVVGGLIAPTTRLEQYTIQLTSGLESIHGSPLKNPNSYVGQTVNPDITWTAINSALQHFDNSSYISVWGDKYLVSSDHTAHVYLVTSASYNDLNGASGVTSSPDAHKTDVSDIFTGYSNDFNVRIVNDLARPRDKSAIMGTVTTMFKANGSIWTALNKSLQVVLGAAADIAGAEVLNIVVGGADASTTILGKAEESAVSKVVSGILGAADGGWTFSHRDWKMASSAWTGTLENWWGAAPSFQLSKNSDGENTYPEDMGNTTTTVRVDIK